MPDNSLSEAIKEAYASAPADVIIHHTIEMRHPSFASPLRVVRDYKSINATLEDTAPVDASTEVTFSAYAFDIVKPEINSDGRPQITIEIDNVSREIITNVEAAMQTNDSIEVTYREYISSDLTSPQNDPPLHMTIVSITADIFRVSAVATFGDFTNRRFPAATYTSEDFPGLVSQ